MKGQTVTKEWKPNERGYNQKANAVLNTKSHTKHNSGTKEDQSRNTGETKYEQTQNRN